MKFEKVEKKPSRYPIVMRFRASHEDYDLVKARAAETGHSLSVYLRKRAVGGKIPRPIQDLHDLNQLRQHMGLLKTLVKESKEIRPTLQAIETLIAKMSAKVE